MYSTLQSSHRLKTLGLKWDRALVIVTLLFFLIVMFDLTKYGRYLKFDLDENFVRSH